MLRQKEPEQPIGHTYYFATGHCSDGVDHYVKTEPGAAFIAFLGFIAVFMVNYRWTLWRVGQAVNRKSRKLRQS